MLAAFSKLPFFEWFSGGFDTRKKWYACTYVRTNIPTTKNSLLKGGSVDTPYPAKNALKKLPP